MKAEVLRVEEKVELIKKFINLNYQFIEKDLELNSFTDSDCSEWVDDMIRDLEKIKNKI